MAREHRDTNAMRLIASFFVVLLHAAAQRMAATPPGEAGDWFICLCNALSRFSVPLFIMISGRYMLAVPCSFRRAAKKAGEMLIALLLWGGLYLVYDLFTGWRPAGGGELVFRWLTEPVHLWYFYAAMAFYLFTPILSVFTCNATKEQLWYAVALTALFGSVVTTLLRTQRFALLAAVMEKTKIPYAMGFLCCYLLGFCLERWPLKKRESRILVLLGILGAGLTFAGTLFLSRRSGGWNEWLLSFYAPNVLVFAAAVYQIALSCLRGGSAPWLGKLAGTTGVIYGVHMLLLWQVPESWPLFAAACAAWGLSCILGTALQQLHRIKRLFK